MVHRPADRSMYDFTDDGGTEDMVGLMDATQIHGEVEDEMEYEVDGTEG